MKKTPGTTDKDKANYWQAIIEEARKYPAGITAYCADKGVPHGNYYVWFKRLRPEHPEWADLGKDKSHTARRVRAKRRADVRKETEVEEKSKRRRFTAAEKARILREIDAAPPGKVASILRREGLYSSHLTKWRRERDEAALVPKKRGPKPDIQAAKTKMLEKKVMRLERKLAHAQALIQLQKKVAEILETSLPESEETD